ncbi:MAG: hypothetical protein UV63_C0061G0003 [Microgenomates group bacterium GW2011_GWC1_43_11]|uniref:Uncharacterized protein n=2 Tax=Candidatus Gottesmaniibacteriota TaxID=1752720 RepID=A0A0G1JLE7_9BACT|nr:MAG: hypothetical protein UV63_C0061G0003 [Microgenomates group bacterium GW2011_GWC1_43_11]KKT36269.1 MAG: hypothetical protein UW22_C0041G0012 [Candidatus Gottesmanbacteria bacterium GW2011_GWB1_44_11c]HCM82806.1 hypothetical protein [Patescibacteria group bacterium]
MSKGEVFVQRKLGEPFEQVGTISERGDLVNVSIEGNRVDVLHGEHMIGVRDPASGTVMERVYPDQARAVDVPGTESRILVIHE